MFSLSAADASLHDDIVDDTSYVFLQNEDDLAQGDNGNTNLGNKDDGHGHIGFDSLGGIDDFQPFTDSGPSSVQYNDLLDISESTGSNTENKDGDDTDITMPDFNEVVDTNAWREESASTSEPKVKMETEASSWQRDLAGASNSMNGSILPTGQRLKLLNNASRHNKPNARASNGKKSISTGFSPSTETKRSASSTPDAKDPNDISQEGTPTTTRLYNKKLVPPEPRPRSSIPADLSQYDFGHQCLVAAESSRLDPYRLHREEYELLKDHITQPQVTVYLNIRNAILRLWTRNPLVYVPRDEALGCAKESRFFSLAEVCYRWLMRRGYINFGCLQLPDTTGSITRVKAKGRRRTIVIIGAGVSGLGCARQLTGLFRQLGSKFSDNGEKPPRIIILEGSNRIGGRVYSHPLRRQNQSTLPDKLRCTAEMGAQIVTGFERGNPLNVILRGQLALHLYPLTDNTLLYDADGKPIDQDYDIRVQKLYNDVLDRATTFKSKTATFETAEGDSEMIYWQKDPSTDGTKLLSDLDRSEAATGLKGLHSRTSKNTTVTKAGRGYVVGLGEQETLEPAAKVAKELGWELLPGVSETQSIDLEKFVRMKAHPTLGETMDEAIRQYQRITHLSPQDLRLLNWHHANQEYANAANVNDLSLSNWDQDLGNEFDGRHSEVIGGYQQFPQGLWQLSSPLDVRFNRVVKKIQYSTSASEDTSSAKVICKGGETFEADMIVMTTSLGVLKSETVAFEPALPDWKQGAIKRLGFGLLNKIILIFEKPFWEHNRDMFGLLNNPAGDRLRSEEMSDYTNARGRLYLFWNRTTQAGRPTLVALMAGEAAHDAEKTADNILVDEAWRALQQMFKSEKVPRPCESIVTRWKSNPFVRGTYSYVGPEAVPTDYEDMARPVGPIHFAGEATCGTHPATVHGAYLSGLRAASDVMDDLLGKLVVPTPLIPRKVKLEQSTANGLSNSSLTETHRETVNSAARAADEDYESTIINSILQQLGERPLRPLKAGVNPFLLYTKDYWHKCKEQCDEAKRKTTNSPTAKASKVEIRVALGKMWRNAPDEIKQPYLAITDNAKEASATMMENYKAAVEHWDREATRIRTEFVEQNPMPFWTAQHLNSKTALEMADMAWIVKAGKR